MSDSCLNGTSLETEQLEFDFQSCEFEVAFSLLQDLDPDASENHLKESVIDLVAKLHRACIGNEERVVELASPQAASWELDRVKWLVAGNPQTPPRLLALLARDAITTLLQRIAENPRTPAVTLAELASHSESDVRAAVAENANTPEDGLWRLVLDESPDVRFSLAESYHLSQEMLDLLAEDDNPYVAFRAKQTLSRLNPIDPLEQSFVRASEQQRRKQS
jgi:hypothetical protein